MWNGKTVALVYVVRRVLIAHLERLARHNVWPPGAPADYITDFRFGEVSALDHCDDVVAILEGEVLP